MNRNVKFIGKALGIVVLLYGVAAAVLYFFQDNFIFQGDKLPQEHTFVFNQKFEEHFIATDDGEKLNVLLFKSDQPAKGLILYFHGNASNLQRWGEYAVDFTSLGYDILMVDYRGYGKSSGTPNEDNLYQDAETVLKWSQSKINYTRLIIYGRSLGTAVATNLAANSTPDLLILETPFDELKSLLYSFPARYAFKNNEALKKVKCERVIIHGTEDGVIPLSSALKLKPLLGTSDKFVIIEGGSHNDLRKFDKYHATIKEVLN